MLALANSQLPVDGRELLKVHCPPHTQARPGQARPGQASRNPIMLTYIIYLLYFTSSPDRKINWGPSAAGKEKRPGLVWPGQARPGISESHYVY